MNSCTATATCARSWRSARAWGEQIDDQYRRDLERMVTSPGVRQRTTLINALRAAMTSDLDIFRSAISAIGARHRLQPGRPVAMPAE